VFIYINTELVDVKFELNVYVVRLKVVVANI